MSWICPLCKEDNILLPARLTENSIRPEGLKCKKCLGTWIVDGTSHLKRVDGKQEPPAGTVPVEVNKIEIKQEELTAVEIEKVAAVKQALAPLKQKFENEEDKAEAWRRLVAGDRPSVIAREMGYKLHVINNYKQNNKKKLEEESSGEKTGENKPAQVAGVVEKKAQYSPQERLDIVSEYKAGLKTAEQTLKTYGITANQLKGWVERERYYRRVVKLGSATKVQSMKNHRSWVLRMLTQLDNLSMDKVDHILDEYKKILQDEIVEAKEVVSFKKAALARVEQVQAEIKNREMECRHTISKTLRGL